jgi:peptidyl-prolyl cis-trans isomerase B (cyclophilin B)
MKRFWIILTAALLLFAAIGCKSTATYSTASDKTAAAEEPKATEEPKQTEEEPTVKNPIATITMKDGGVMKLELYPDVAPNTVKNFISLANSGFYDGLTFHRIYAGFMIQGGDPDGNGGGGPGYSIKGEFTANGVKNNLSHKRGVISMARATPFDSAGSQFFIMHADYTGLDGQYAAFGMLIEGFDTLDAIAATETGYNDWGEKSVPLKDVVIDTIRVDTFGVDYGEPEKIQ